MAIGPVSLPGLGDANPLRQNTAIRQLSERLEDYAPLADPVFTGDPQAPTPSLSDNDTSVATTAFVKGQDYTTKTYVDAADAILTTAVAGKAATVHTHAESDVTGLVADLAAKEPTIAAGTTSQYWRGDKSWQPFPSAKVVNRYYTSFSTWTTITTVIPLDNTVPTSSEGVQVLSLSATTTTSTQILRITMTLPVYGTTHTIGAIFQGSTCIYAAATQTTTAADVLTAVYEYSPAAASSYTISVRVGPQSGTSYVNGASGSALFGGVCACTLVVEILEP